MKIRVLLQTGIFLTNWGTIGILRRIFHRFSKIACYFVWLNSGLNFNILISTYMANTSITMSGSHHVMRSADCETNNIHLYLSSISAEIITYYIIPNILSLFSFHQTDTHFYSRLLRQCLFTNRSSRLLHCVSAVLDVHVSSFLRALSVYTEDAATVFTFQQFLVNAFHSWLNTHCNCWPVNLGAVFQ